MNASGSGHCIQTNGGMAATNRPNPAMAHMLYRQAESAARDGDRKQADKLERLARGWGAR